MLLSRQKSERDVILRAGSVKLDGLGRGRKFGREMFPLGQDSRNMIHFGLGPCRNPVPQPAPSPACTYKLGSCLNSPSSLISTFLYFPDFLLLLITRTTTPATRANTTTTMTAMRPLVRRFMENLGGFSSR